MAADWDRIDKLLQEAEKKDPSLSSGLEGMNPWESAQQRAEYRQRERNILGVSSRLEGDKFDSPGYEAGFESPPPPNPNLWGAGIDRLMGTDVPHDPAVLRRAATTGMGSVGGWLGTAKLLQPVSRAMQAVPNPIVRAVAPYVPHVGGFLAGGQGARYGSRFPEDMTSLAEYAGLVEKGHREKYLLNDTELKTIMRGELIVDMGTGGILSTLKHGYRGASRILQLAGKDSQAQAAAARELGLEMPGTASAGSFFERVWTPVFARIPMWGGPITRRAKLASEQMIDVLNMKIMGPIVSETSVGRRLYEGAKETVKEFNTKYGDLYDAVWARADVLGVKINPKLLRDEAQEILNEIADRAVRQGEEAPGDKALVDFIMKKVMHKDSSLSGGEVTLTQMDGFLKDMFQTKTVMAKEGRHADALFERLRQASIANTVDEGSLFSIKGERGAVEQVVKDLRQVNQDFGRELRAVFETTGAIKFNRFERGGLRSVGMTEAGTSAIDETAKAFKNVDSPQIMQELKNLMPDGVWDEFVQLRLQESYNKALTVTTREGKEYPIFNPAVFRKSLGLDSPKSARYETTEFLINSQSRLSMDDLNTFLKGSEEIQKMDIPNPYQLAQRRAGLAGIGGAVGAFMIGSGAGGYAGYEATGGSLWGAAIGAISALLPARGVSMLLANPRAAVPIKNLISETAPATRKAKSALQLVRLTITAGIEKGEVTREEGEEVYREISSIVQNTDWTKLYKGGLKSPEQESTEQKADPLPMGVSPFDDVQTTPEAMPTIPDPLQGRGPDFRSRMRPPVAPTVGPQWNPAPQMSPENMAMLQALKRVPTQERGFTPVPNR